MNSKIDVSIPPPRFVEQGAKPPLPIVVPARYLDSSSSLLLSPNIKLNNDDDAARLPVRRWDRSGQVSYFVFRLSSESTARVG